MSLNAWFKSKTADKVLSPLREQLVKLIDKNSKVIEIGCGTGDLLFKASKKITYGLGLDINQGMINFAKNKSQDEKVNNIEFTSVPINSLSNAFFKNFDISTSTLCLHEMQQEDAASTLSMLGSYSRKIIIADYATPKTVWGKISIEIDEIISGHYLRFRNYRNSGGIPFLVDRAGLEIISEITTPIDGIMIWVLSGNIRHSNNDEA